MPEIGAFQTYTDRYDEWFDTYESAYQSEVAALSEIRPDGGPALEIGVGTGRFAVPLEVEYGLDPSVEMLKRAIDRGITGIIGAGEALPLRRDSVRLALLITTICFVDDVDETLREAARVLEPGGHILLGYIDKESDLGEQYQADKDENPFYRNATFVSTDELRSSLESAGFESLTFRQTIFERPSAASSVDPVEEGYGRGLFVALKATYSGRA